MFQVFALLTLFVCLLQHTATHCNTLQHTATHCNSHSLSASCNTLQHTATHCNTLQHTATHCNSHSVSADTGGTRRGDGTVFPADYMCPSNRCLEMFRLMGLPTLVAPGEAEALCAQLTDERLADFVVTPDGDALCFGARSVIKVFVSVNIYMYIRNSFGCGT